MPNVSILIPCAPYHESIVQRAIDSAEKQTVAVNVLWSVDEDEQGPGVVRNRLMEHVETPYVVFLDADDWLAPTFVEECLRVIKPRRYVYTDWYNPDDYRHAPDHPYCYKDYLAKTWHIITALLPTPIVRQMGGFDERLPALEDTDFYLRLTRAQGVCGIHIRKALAYYGKEGQRAQRAKDEGYERDLLTALLDKYKDIPMPCCGDDTEIDQDIPVGERQPNDVLAQAIWRGNRREYGRATRRWYPRMSYPMRTWVDKRDIEMSPHLWQEVMEVVQTDNGNTGLEALIQVFHHPKPESEQLYLDPDPPTPKPTVPSEPPDFTPNVDYILRVAKERL